MEKIKNLRNIFLREKIDGYIIPKNDEFFGEYTTEYNDRLKFISKFSGSYGFALILRDKNYLFVDGRYSIQAKIESGKHFDIVDYFKIINTKVFKNLNIGIDPTLFTSEQIKKFLALNDRYGIPYNEIYSPLIPEGKIFPELLTINVIKEYLDLAK